MAGPSPLPVIVTATALLQTLAHLTNDIPVGVIGYELIGRHSAFAKYPTFFLESHLVAGISPVAYATSRSPRPSPWDSALRLAYWLPAHPSAAASNDRADSRLHRAAPTLTRYSARQ